MFTLIRQMAQKGACITHDSKNLIISLSEKYIKLNSNKL